MKTILVMVGLPGSGKGTQSALIASKLGMLHISTGSLLRQAIENEDELGLMAKKYVNAGQLVPDDLILKLVYEQIANSKANGIILDGFPRNLAQAQSLEEKLPSYNYKVNVVVYLDLDKETLLERLSGRRISSNTGKEYHLKYNPPKVAGQCDIDQSELVQREDDKPEKIEHRFKVFKNETGPMIDYFEKKKLLFKFNADQAPELLASEIMNKIKV